MKKIVITISFLSAMQVMAQETGTGKTNSYLDYSWEKVATQMPAELVAGPRTNLIIIH